MGPPTIPFSGDADVPRRVDTAIIGGGIIGIATALALVERGQKVVVAEKGEIAGEQSSRNWGWCRQARRDPREFDLARESLRLWRGMNERVEADTGFVPCGTFFAARDEPTLERYEKWIAEAGQAGIAAQMASASQVQQLLTGDSMPPPTGLWCASDGCAEPQRAVPLMANAARRHGATILTGCAVRGMETAAGRIVGIVTERGPIACNAVVVAGGAWARRILRDLDITIPQLKVRATVSRTQPLPGGPDLCFWDGVLGVRKRADGGYTVANGLLNAVPITPDAFRFMPAYLPLLGMEWRHIRLRLNSSFADEWRDAAPVPLDRPSPYESCRVLDPAPDCRYVEASLAALRRRFPALAAARIEQVWAGMIDAMPDTVPIISPVPTMTGLVVATGFSGHGFGIGPAAGELVADMVTGGKPLVDPHAYRIERFWDGTMPRPFGGV